MPFHVYIPHAVVVVYIVSFIFFILLSSYIVIYYYYHICQITCQIHLTRHCYVRIYRWDC